MNKSKAQPVGKIKCPDCNWYDSEDKKQKYLLPYNSTKWQCPECGEIHILKDTLFSMVVKVPTKIYLQVLNEDGEEPDVVTWDEDRVFDTDIVYVLGNQSEDVFLGENCDENGHKL